MPITVKYLQSGAGVVYVGSGVVTGREIISANEEIYARHRLLPQKYQLCDLLKVERFDVSEQELATLAGQDIAASKINPDVFVAIVAERDVISGLAHVWEELVGDSQFDTSVFSTMAEADTWIREKLAAQ